VQTGLTIRVRVRVETDPRSSSGERTLASRGVGDTHVVVEWHFAGRDDGIIEADLGPKWAGFTEALNDSVTTRAPRGHTPGLSTYWIDRTLDALKEASGSGTVIASGNATELILDGEQVVARSQYEVRDDERMHSAEFEAGLRAWRRATVERLG
jgi:hypothetical protein